MRHAFDANASQAVASRLLAAAVVGASTGASTSISAAGGSPLRMRRTLSGQDLRVRAIVVTSHGGPDVLELRTSPSRGRARTSCSSTVEAIGVNYRDVYEREGRGAAYGAKLPLIVGAEGAGTVAAGGGAYEFAERRPRRVGAAPASYAERVRVRTTRRSPVPDGVSSDVAAAALLQGMTAHYLCYSTYPVQAGDVVVVHAAAGGVGLLLTQMVKAAAGA